MGRVSFTAELDEADGPLLLSRERRVSRDSFLRFIQANPDLRTELTAEGEMIVMAPVHSRSGHQNAQIAIQLGMWALQDGQGQAYDSSTGFDLPDGSNRSPDASWVAKSRLAMLTEEEREGFLPLCPDFVVELRSKTDSLRMLKNMLKNKMHEYIVNGASLGWLIDPIDRTVHVYRARRSIEVLKDPVEISGEPELPGFMLDLHLIFNPEF